MSVWILRDWTLRAVCLMGIGLMPFWTVGCGPDGDDDGPSQSVEDSPNPDPSPGSTPEEDSPTPDPTGTVDETPETTPAPSTPPTEPEGSPEPSPEETPEVGDTPVPLGEPDEIVEILIVGAGPAGLAAAIECETAGASYLLLDMDIEVGGAARWSAGLMLFAGTSTQVNAGVVDSPEQLLVEWPVFTGGDPEDPWVQAWAYNSVAEVHDWLGGLGYGFQGVAQLSDSGEVPRIHMSEAGGQGLADRLAAEVQTSNLLLEHRVDALTTVNGQLLGVQYTDLTSGATGWIQASAVIMATGGFLRDLERVVQARPDLDGVELWSSTGVYAQGMGHDMAESLGAATENLASIGLYAHGIADYRRPEDREELLISNMQYTLLLNQNAERFMNEADVFNYATGDALARQPAGIAHALFDADVQDRLMLGDPMVEPSDPPEEPSLAEALTVAPNACADDLETLATAIGMDYAALTIALEEYAQGAEDRADAMGKNPDYVDEMNNPPYCALRVVPVLAKAFGGISVDLTGRVLDQSGAPIEGLFAAGELTGMAGGTLVGESPFTGSLSAVLYSGRVAGRGALDWVQ